MCGGSQNIFRALATNTVSPRNFPYRRSVIKLWYSAIKVIIYINAKDKTYNILQNRQLKLPKAPTFAYSCNKMN